MPANFWGGGTEFGLFSEGTGIAVAALTKWRVMDRTCSLTEAQGKVPDSARAPLLQRETSVDVQAAGTRGIGTVRSGGKGMQRIALTPGQRLWQSQSSVARTALIDVLHEDSSNGDALCFTNVERMH